MRYMMMVKADKNYETGQPPDPKLMAAVGKHAEDMAKAGVLAMTRSLAVEWGNRGIRFNAIGPGAIPTEGAFSRLLPLKELEEQASKHSPVGRFGTHEELANLAAFLISDHAGYINGEFIVMDGGALLKGAGSFNQYGDSMTEEQWQAIRPRKK